MSFTAEQLGRRRELVPEVTYPDLPVSERRDDIAEAIRDHQVVVIAGETGSGKTTQLPKICLQLGRGIEGLIGHTQPRRIAARSVAERVAEELQRPLGSVVGYQVRFTDRTSEDTLVKVMTDGVLLAEIAHDRLLSKYDTLIIDEAHERSLTIDFLLGYLRQLLPRRPDLRVIITSATIDPARFAAHFEGAPVIEVSGRTYPVEVRYRSLVADTVEGVVERDQVQGICDALQELDREGRGDVLVFLSGEREIRDTAEAVRALPLRDTEVLPLYGRLSSAEQHRVFAPHAGRRIVLSTNVAETSLTVPGIRYVVDPGTARISRYSNRTKVQRLPIEAISQASANQRKGRCGRQSDGICIRLYSEDDFVARPAYTEPEILRTSLAAVLLQMAALDLGEVESFPFLDPPDARQVRDGVQLLEELGALDDSAGRHRLTALGRRLARLPIDPRLGRMVLEAERNGCLPEVLVITAALSIQDPRERPVDREAAAMQSHARFVDRTSDFLTLLNLWDHIQERQGELSSSAFRRMCKAEFLHYLRVREWQDLVAQLRQAARSVGAKTVRQVELAPERNQADADRIHLSLLAGLLSHVAGVGTRLSLADFRSWPELDVALEPGRTVFVGANGNGKTNLLEALGYLAALSSHRVAADAPLIRQGCVQSRIGATVVNEGRELTVEVELNSGSGNRARINRSPARRPREILGILRTVLFAPEDLALVRGDPAERRRFLDELATTRRPRLAAVRADYDRVLRQRGALLKSAGRSSRSRGDGGTELSTLDVWDGHLAAHGAELLSRAAAAGRDLEPQIGRGVPLDRTRIPAGDRVIPQQSGCRPAAGVSRPRGNEPARRRSRISSRRCSCRNSLRPGPANSSAACASSVRTATISSWYSAIPGRKGSPVTANPGLSHWLCDSRRSSCCVPRVPSPYCCSMTCSPNWTGVGVALWLPSRRARNRF